MLSTPGRPALTAALTALRGSCTAPFLSQLSFRRCSLRAALTAACPAPLEALWERSSPSPPAPCGSQSSPSSPTRRRPPESSWGAPKPHSAAPSAPSRANRCPQCPVSTSVGAHHCFHPPQRTQVPVVPPLSALHLLCHNVGSSRRFCCIRTEFGLCFPAPTGAAAAPSLQPTAPTHSVSPVWNESHRVGRCRMCGWTPWVPPSAASTAPRRPCRVQEGCSGAMGGGGGSAEQIRAELRAARVGEQPCSVGGCRWEQRLHCLQSVSAGRAGKWGGRDGKEASAEPPEGNSNGDGFLRITQHQNRAEGVRAAL